ncbi:hypothetical protein F0562_030844 [Nyssa sinensis]|uniref:Uncharacterized protein n=1 Tax=Nyssa sinensis TaxID=561372 RepID=A0A5J5B0X7_9ASTE|nr:hypothetical protein F0562_030844 [Nyssa sinensis]
MRNSIQFPFFSSQISPSNQVVQDLSALLFGSNQGKKQKKNVIFKPIAVIVAYSVSTDSLIAGSNPLAILVTRES